MAKTKTFALVLLIFAFLIPSALAETITKTQTVDFRYIDPVYRFQWDNPAFDPSTGDVQVAYVQVTDDSVSNFPGWSRGYRIANQMIYGDLYLTETYPLQWDFTFGNSLTVSYSILWTIYDVESEVSTCCTLIFRGRAYTPTVIRDFVNGFKTYTFTLDNVSFDSTVNEITFMTEMQSSSWESSSSSGTSARVRTAVFPLTVSSDYTVAEVYAESTNKLLENQIYPSISHISSVAGNIETEIIDTNQKLDGISGSIRSGNQQQHQDSVAERSQIAAQHSESMAAITSLPAAELDEAESRAQAAAASEAAQLADDAAAADQALSSLTGDDGGFNHLENGVLQFLGTFVNTDQRSGVILEFPALKLPAIEGATSSESTLSSSQLLQFDNLFAKIPSTVMLLVQIVVTGGCMIFLAKNVISIVRLIINKGSDPSADIDPVPEPEQFVHDYDHDPQIRNSSYYRF